METYAMWLSTMQTVADTHNKHKNEEHVVRIECNNSADFM